MVPSSTLVTVSRQEAVISAGIGAEEPSLGDKVFEFPEIGVVPWVDIEV
jgi:hypothetical protein